MGIGDNNIKNINNNNNNNNNNYYNYNNDYNGDDVLQEIKLLNYKEKSQLDYICQLRGVMKIINLYYDKNQSNNEI